jgi:hypothetical protein
MLLGALFLVGVVLLALGLRWLSSHNDPVTNRNAIQENSSTVSDAGNPKDKKEVPGKRS